MEQDEASDDERANKLTSTVDDAEIADINNAATTTTTITTTTTAATATSSDEEGEEMEGARSPSVAGGGAGEENPLLQKPGQVLCDALLLCEDPKGMTLQQLVEYCAVARELPTQQARELVRRGLRDGVASGFVTKRRRAYVLGSRGAGGMVNTLTCITADERFREERDLEPRTRRRRISNRQPPRRPRRRTRRI